MPKISLQSAIPILAVVLAVGMLGYAAARSGVLDLGFLSSANPTNQKLAAALGIAEAAAGDNVSGYAWADTIGWISMAGTNYGVNVESTGRISGYAWSDNIGWVSFNSSDTSGCPGSSCVATFTLQNDNSAKVTGWAKVLSDDTWISLSSETDPSGTAYGITVPADSCDWEGYAWSDQYGWISFRGTSPDYGVSGVAGSDACTSQQATPTEQQVVARLAATPNKDTATLDVRVTDQAGNPITGLADTAFTVMLDGADVSADANFFEQSDGTYLALLSDLTDGSHSVRVDVTDQSGNTGFDTDSFNTTSSTAPQCSDGIDNDNDGQTDYPEDDGCSSATDDNETDSPASTPPTPPAPGEDGTEGSITIVDSDTDTAGTGADAASISASLALPSYVQEAGEGGTTKATLSWNWSSTDTFDATECRGGTCDGCRLYGGEFGASGQELSSEDLPSGSRKVALSTNAQGLPQPTTFELLCRDVEGDNVAVTDPRKSGTVDVLYNSATINSLSVSPGNLISIPAGNSVPVTLSWDTSFTDTCTAASPDWSGSWSGSDNTSVTLSADDTSADGDKNYEYQLQCTRGVNSSQDAVAQSVTVTVPGFILTPSVDRIDTAQLCEEIGGQGNVDADVPIPDTTITISPQDDYETSNINFSISIDGETDWINSTSGLSLTNSTASCADSDPSTQGTPSNCTPDEITLSGSINVQCKRQNQDVEQGEAIIRVTGTPASGDTSHANIGLNVETFTPVFEEF